MVMEFNDYEYFDLPERLDYIHQVCSGLNYLHEKDVLCMDLKPANMLVTGPKENVTVKHVVNAKLLDNNVF